MIYDIALRKIDGTDTTLQPHKGEVLLIVNVASKCGLTPQYEGLEALYEKYQDKGLSVLGFPANEFREQEPGTNEEIQEFCTSTYGVKFPMFEKIVVKGEGQHPLYKKLVEARPNKEGDGGKAMRERLNGFGIETGSEEEVLWNFEKFLVNRNGQVVARFSPDTTPDDPDLISAIDEALSESTQ